MQDQDAPHSSPVQPTETPADAVWKRMLTEGNVRTRKHRHIYGMLPTDPRCVLCNRPFAGVGGALLQLIQKTEKSAKNPRFCTNCQQFTFRNPGGAEVVLTMLFVDVRGSTTIAEGMDPSQFSRLMNRFYEATIHELVLADAFIDKLVGDEVTALFIPGFAGPEHAAKAIEAGKALLRVTGHGDAGGPWVPVGVGIHTGKAWVGSIIGASGTAADFTALGDNVNITARLASKAAQGEVLVSAGAYLAAGMNIDGLEIRELELKGKSETVTVAVLKAQ